MNTLQTVIVWALVIFNPGPAPSTIVVDDFPNNAACQRFLKNVKDMVDGGLGNAVTKLHCHMRQRVVFPDQKEEK